MGVEKVEGSTIPVVLGRGLSAIAPRKALAGLDITKLRRDKRKRIVKFVRVGNRVKFIDEHQNIAKLLGDFEKADAAGVLELDGGGFKIINRRVDALESYVTPDDEVMLIDVLKRVPLR